MVFLGKILKSRGNRGEVICRVSTEIEVSKVDFSRQFELRSRKHSRSAKIEFISEKGCDLIIKFDISKNISDSLGLVGYEVFFESIENDMFHSPLKGFSVVDQHGELWGIVNSMDDLAINKTIEVVDGENTRIIPLDDSIVVKIDMKAKIVFIDPPEGLKDLNIK